MIHCVMIINKAGGLIYNKDFGNGISKLTSNEYLVLAGTFHGIHAITSQISPCKGNGIELVQSENFNLYCFQSTTGMKFILITDSHFQNLEITCLSLYEIYCDYAMKNPFYQPEMPIRAELFDLAIVKSIKSINA
jgi:trafficking protein particle complex subunit 4